MMPHVRLVRRLSLLLLAALLYSAYAVAQSPVDPGKLPGRTLFYLLWRGTPSGEIRTNNSVFALWDDPQFASARASFLDSVVNDSANQKSKTALSREEFEQYVTLLDNPFLIGNLRRPDSRPSQKSSVDQVAAPPAWNGTFFIYDRTGKEELLSKAVVRMRSTEKDIPKLTELTVAGIPALKVERKSGITYWAEFGKYAVSANEMAVFEEVLNVVNGKSAGTALGQSMAYQEAKPLLSGGILEFFLGVPTVEQMGLDTSNAVTVQVKPLLTALKLEALHSVAGRVSLEGARTRMTGAILGDTAPGGIFDFFADGQANPVSMGYLSTDTVYYGESQFNLLGIYNLLKRAFTSAGETQGQTANPFEQMAETRLGMPLPDALGLVTGEIAWFQTSPTLDDTQKVYLLGIHKQPDALKLTRTLMGDQITSERNEGDTTYMKISLRGGQSSAGLAQWNFYYLAMTPTLLFGSSKADVLHKYVAQTPAAPDATQFKNLLAARAQYPEKLNGFSYFDFQKVDWAGLRTKWIADANKAALTAKSTDASNTQKKISDWLTQVNPDVFPRHLHSVTGASWKDAKGVHFDEWLD
ncbi:MAG TPA: hypothetical protein VJX72_12410 [Candidatus Acidoferrum sp.]|nr:hypothetical protein [Candidatus Acidoferrum sp.]